jgi:hypothetical protein
LRSPLIYYVRKSPPLDLILGQINPYGVDKLNLYVNDHIQESVVGGEWGGEREVFYLKLLSFSKIV